MPAQPIETRAPAGSAIARQVPGSYFHDAWSITAEDPSLDAFSQFLRVARVTPAWIEAAMGMRNRLVGLVGLKNLGRVTPADPSRPAASYRPGDRVGIFTLQSVTDTEVLLGDSDKHLDVVLSLHQQPLPSPAGLLVTVTTVVKVHNRLGRLYMAPMRPAHRVIAQAMVRAVGNPLP